jgi:heme/copper-type cytochrome/quinol oxidase subunit 2
MLDVIFWIVAAACIIAQWFILRAVWRVIPAASVAPSVPMPKRASEIAWAILPALLLAAAFVGAWRSMHPASPDFHPPSSHGAPVAPVARS